LPQLLYSTRTYVVMAHLLPVRRMWYTQNDVTTQERNGFYCRMGK
jgi:hypothetical protein